ncbi:MAG: nitroreductase family protein [Kiritimatiellia bacterium]
MNSKLESIFARRSVRAYREGEIPDGMIKDLLEAAMAAPSAVAKDPWHFIVIKDKGTLAKVAEALPNGQMLKQAAAGIVVCGDMEKAHGNEESYMLQDCSAAIENLLLAASMLGLGAVWLGVHPRPERVSHIKNVFGLPENIIPVSAVSLGWPEKTPEPRTRYDETSVHRERW